MAIRLRKSIKITPGVRLNLSKSGISASIGKRGATVNISKQGTRVTAGIPGTGLSASHLYKAGQKASSSTAMQYTKTDWLVAWVIVEVITIFVAIRGSGLGLVAAILIPVGIVIWLTSKKSRQSQANNMENITEPVGPLAVSAIERLNLEAKVDDVPTSHYAAIHKNDLGTMQRCCDAEVSNYWSQLEGSRVCAAPFYFQRVAILQRKAKDYAAEIEVCERWIKIINDYQSQYIVKAGHAALVHESATSSSIVDRLPKARGLLYVERQRFDH